MRAFEFLTEKTMMTGAQLSKGQGKYIKSIIDAISNGLELNFTVGKDEFTGRVKNSQGVVADLQALVANAEELPNKELKFRSDPGAIKIDIETDDGEIIQGRVSQIVKDEKSKGAFTFNLGNVAEAIMGSAMTSKFEKLGGNITVDDAKNVGIRLFDSNGFIESKAGKDSLTFKMTVPGPDAKAFYAFLGKGATLKELGVDAKKIKSIEKMYADAVSYVNSSPRATAAVDKAKADPHENKVEVLSDGGNAEKQSITKVDLEIIYDGTKVNLISLKAGAVKQIGQESGAEFETLERFFKTTVGFGLPGSMAQMFKPKTDPEYKEYNYTYAFPKAYDHMYNELKSHVTGDSTHKEYSLVQSIYNGINYHGTRGEEGVILVILNPSAKEAYKELSFGKPLLDALNDYNLEVTKKTDGKNYIIEVYGIAKTAEAKKLDSKAMLIQFRSYKQAKAVRNAVEIGPLLKDLADLQKLDKKKPKDEVKLEAPPAPKDEIQSLKKNAGIPAQPAAQTPQQPATQQNQTEV